MLSSASPTANDPWKDWIEQARLGSREALGLLLDKCRNYLLAVAHGAHNAQLQSKAGSSDLVQETFFQAQRNFAGFTGTSEAELLAWYGASSSTTRPTCGRVPGYGQASGRSGAGPRRPAPATRVAPCEFSCPR